MIGDNAASSTRPYLIRALHDWCTDNGFTPYIAVHVDDTVAVPTEYVKNNEIVLNVGFEATSGLELGNEFIVFKARFGGTARDISVPVDHVVAIYARENGQGMAFPLSAELQAATSAGPSTAPVGVGSPAPAETGSKVGLRLATSADVPPPPDEPRQRKPRAPRAASPKPTAVPSPASGAEQPRSKKPSPKPVLPPAPSGDNNPPTEPTPPGRPTLTRIK